MACFRSTERCTSSGSPVTDGAAFVLPSTITLGLMGTWDFAWMRWRDSVGDDRRRDCEPASLRLAQV
ncbi:uncharacterized protein SEPMUDRAFT_149307 [Sphaerulina musiva SO2202]|uniref:Uncharacterized protein n=1 Tax=Sphaerulina musiva (strain SO2202) TaxID=692275 RepID=M3D3C0_SPHMS|nr:uncharacterized protein SEPMUDRAFT_149307 [Sphaerulina musiva SO2202]EMF12725.1 hypothetical protein SEPMUDRAFT_149307 [Sphaerulina musiva SO2202]